MIEIGRIQELEVIREKEFGVYLGESAEDTKAVLLPSKQVPEGTKTGDKLKVFIYKDSEDRVIATTRTPMACVDGMAVMKVKDVTKIGAFLDWGFEKDLFLPFKEQTTTIHSGDNVFVWVYLDKSSRLCATMKVYEHLCADSPYQAGDQVDAVVYRINPKMGVFLAVKGPEGDHKFYYGMVPNNQVYDKYELGNSVKANVVKIREDGKMDLSFRQNDYLQMDDDSATILRVIAEYGGTLPFGEKASPELIKREMHMSKSGFKRALGHLLKEGKIEILADNIRIKN